MAISSTIVLVILLSALVAGALRAWLQAKDKWMFNIVIAMIFGLLLGWSIAREGLSGPALALLVGMLSYVCTDLFESVLAIAKRPPWKLRKGVILWQ